MRSTRLFALCLGIPLTGCAPALISAAKRGDVAKMESLLQQGQSVEVSDGNGKHWTPLFYAVTRGHTAAVRLLLERGANPNITRSPFDMTPLHWATQTAGGTIYASEKAIEIINLLLKHGADPTPRDFDGKSPLDYLMDRSIDRVPGIAAVRALARSMAAAQSPGVDTPVAPQPVAERQNSVPTAAMPAIFPSYSSAERPEDYAIVIGVEKYIDLPAASHAERDAEAVRNFVKALGVPERNIMTLTGARATRTGLEKTIEDWLPNNVSEKSRVFVFYSGHGAPDPKTGDAYLVPSDGDPQYLARTGYPLKRLYAKLGELKAKKVVVALDSCFSGAGGRSVLAKGTRPLVGKVDLSVGAASKRIEVLSASGADQISGANDEAGYGLFTYNLLQGLNGGAKDASGKITVRSLYDYVRPRVADQARRANRDQTPQLQAEGEGAVLREK